MTIDKDFYIAHIQGDKYIFKMKKVLDSVEMVLKNYRVESTDFLDPYERYLAKSILNRFDDIHYLEDGGLEQSERKIMVIFPHFFDQNEVDEKISFLRIEYPNMDLSHKDFLGAVLNMGITRDKLGDLYVHENQVDFVVRDEVKDFLLFNLKQVGNYKIKVHSIERKNLQISDEEFKEVDRFVSSLRLDSMISSIYNISRKNSLKLIKSEKVKINYKPINKPSIELKEGDLISVRGYGRSTFHSINGFSRKRNYNITFKILI